MKLLTVTYCSVCGKNMSSNDIEEISMLIDLINPANPTSYKVACPCGAVIPLETFEEWETFEEEP
jgi:hypothetical protein